FDDQVLAADAERRLLAEFQPTAWARFPPDDAVVVGESVQTRADGRRTCRFVVRTLQPGVFAFELRAARSAPHRPPCFNRRIQRPVEGTEPSAFPGIVDERRDHEQVAGTCGSDIRQADAFCLVAYHLLRLVVMKLVRGPAANLYGTQLVRRIEIPA